MSVLLRVPIFIAGITLCSSLSASPIEEPSKTRVDRYGDLLPTGVIERLGSIRFHHRDTVLAVAFSADGKTLASGGNDFTLRLWDRGDGKETRHFGQQPLWGSNMSSRAVHAVAF